MARPIAPLEERRLLGIGFMIIGYLTFTVVDTCAKWLLTQGMPNAEVVFIRYAVQLLLVSALFLPSRGAGLLVTRNLKLEVVRGLVLMGSTIFNFWAMLYLPLTVTSAIMFTMPLMLTALSIPLLGETVGWRRWLAIIVGFVGILIIVQPGSEAFNPAVGLSLVAALFTALYFLLTRKLAGVDNAATQQFYAAFVATVCIAPFSFGGWTWPTDPIGWLALLMIGTAALIGHQFLTTAHRFAPASVLAPFGYVQIIFMSASSWLIFNQPPGIWLYVGAPIVIGSGLYIWLRERALHKQVVTEVAGRD